MISVQINSYRAAWENHIGLSFGIIDLQGPKERQNVRDCVKICERQSGSYTHIKRPTLLHRQKLGIEIPGPYSDLLH